MTSEAVHYLAIQVESYCDSTRLGIFDTLEAAQKYIENEPGAEAVDVQGWRGDEQVLDSARWSPASHPYKWTTKYYANGREVKS